MANHVALFFHLVWATRDREPILTADLEPKILAWMAAKSRELRCVPLALGAMPDHVHLLISAHPTVAISTMVKEIKGVSSYYASRDCSPTRPLAWQIGYGVFSVSRNDLAMIRSYVLNQKDHHARRQLLRELERA